jgi:hypothetical protein
MIETSLSQVSPATVLHRVAGTIDHQQAEHGAAEALRLVVQLSGEHGPLNLVLDLRDKHFADLWAHRAWSQGFARNPGLQGHVRRVAIVGDDTPAFRAEQEMMASELVGFFVDLEDAQAWLAQSRAATPDTPRASR